MASLQPQTLDVNTPSPRHSDAKFKSPKASHEYNAIYRHLQNVSAKDIATTKDLHFLRTSDSVEKAVKVLSTNKILSAPVLEAKSDHLAGFIDMLDIVAFITRAAPSPMQLQADELGTLTIAGRAIALVALDQVINKSGRDTMVTFFEDTRVSSIIPSFTQGVHRAALTNSEDKIVAIISQTDVARYLTEHLRTQNLKAIGERSLIDLGYATSELVTIKIEDSVLFALNELVSHNINGLAIVDENGRLVGNFSASNLRGLYYDKFPAFLDSVHDFLTEKSPNSLSPVVGIASSSLIEITNELVASKLHHLWIVENFKPVGIIAMSDIMKIILNAHD